MTDAFLQKKCLPVLYHAHQSRQVSLQSLLLHLQSVPATWLSALLQLGRIGAAVQCVIYV